MHDQEIVHGNLNGVCACNSMIHVKLTFTPKSNVLIDNNDRARLGGFSSLTIIPGELVITPLASTSNTTRSAGSIQWSAPEVLEGGAPSKKADVFSLAMVMIEARHR